MSSLAQEESRSISENTTWGQRKRFADGKASVAYKRFLGYDRGPNGGFIVNKEQAKTVKRIYKYFLEGMTYYGIARKLTELEEPTPGGQKKWHTKTVESILTNEKYKGDALLQKSYTVDFLSKKMKKNEGEVPQYYVENNHEAIIDPATFDAVQVEIQKRANADQRYSGVGIFSSKIKCGECGSWYGAKVWHSTDQYRKVIYRCNHKFDKDKKCSTPHISEDEIKAVFVRALNALSKGNEDSIADMMELQKIVSDTAVLEQELETVTIEMNALVEQTQRIVSENAMVALDQARYAKRHNSLVERYEDKKSRYDALTEAIETKKAKSETIGNFITDLRSMEEEYIDFDEALWSNMVDYITVYSKKDIRVTFKGGLEITA
jgi:site-specific DNA recombinase